MTDDPRVEECADLFETYASDQIASKRWQTLKRDKVECDIKATIWRDAASEVRRLFADAADPVRAENARLRAALERAAEDLEACAIVYRSGECDADARRARRALENPTP